MSQRFTTEFDTSKQFYDARSPVKIAKEDPNLGLLLTTHPDFQTVASNLVSRVDDMKGGAAYLLNNTGTEQPEVVANALGNAAGFRFDGVDDELVLQSGTIDTDSAFTWVTFLTANFIDAGQQLVSNYQSTNTGTWMGLRADNSFRFQHGNGQIDATIPDGVPTMIAASCDTSIMRLQINGGEILTASTDNAGSSQNLRLGSLNGASQFAEMDFGLFAHLNSDHLASANDLDFYRLWARTFFGISTEL